MPLACLVTVVVSLNTRSRIPKGTALTMVRLQAPESLSAALSEHTPLSP